MSNILTIIKKELKRFFTDRRMITSLILPGLIIFILYSFMGSFMGDIGKTPDDYKYNVVIQNIEEHNKVQLSLGNDIVLSNFIITEYNSNEVANDENYYKKQLNSKAIDLVIQYPNNFYDDSLAFDPVNDSKDDLPIIIIQFDSSISNSSNAYAAYAGWIESFSAKISIKFIPFPINTAEESALAATIITMLVPFLLIIFLFTGAMSISVESIAGEKERGTIATLLATPVKRSEFALGKIISLSIVAMVSASSSFLGLFLSLPKLVSGTNISFNIYGPGTYILLFIVLISTTLIFVVLVSLISAYAKNVKEANSYSSILMFVNMAVTIPSMAGVSTTNTFAYLIPVYNSVQSLTSILGNNFNAINFVVTIIVNFAVVGLGVFGLTKMFNSERIMYSK